MYTSISPVFSYKSYSVATPRHPEPLLLENHVRIIALTPDLQRVSFYSVIDFLSATSDDSLKVMAVCVDEHCNGRGITIRVAANTGDLSAVTTGFVRLARALEHAARRGWVINLLPF